MDDIDAHKPAAYPPSETALLLLDCQNFLVSMIPDQEQKNKLRSSAKTLLDTARKNNVAIVHCMIDTTQDPSPANKMSEQWLTVFKPILSSVPAAGAELADIAAMTGDKIEGGARRETVSMRPPGPRSAFVAEGLESLLRDGKLWGEHLILGGVATSGAVLGTALHGTDLGFVVTIVEDSCWDPNQGVHRALIDTVIPAQAWVASVEEAVGYMSA
ncbi:hypothetical protein PG995_011456 [Apiospora arundinis]